MKIIQNANLSAILMPIDTCDLYITKLEMEKEGQTYEACSYELGTLKVRARRSKITPKKCGQFVTVWKRDENGQTTPFKDSDSIDLLVITSCQGSLLGQFIFPKSILVEKGIIASSKNRGKRGFRVYPPWSKPMNKTAQSTQRWQKNYFIYSEK
ncbi:MepB family protein [Arenibacter aquaticus]|nr:MepB family protein [Arenibacter aquaticus]